MSCLLANNILLFFSTVNEELVGGGSNSGVIAGAVVGVLFIGLVITGVVLLLVIYRERTKLFNFTCMLVCCMHHILNI